MEKQISRIEKFVDSLQHGELQEEQSMVLQCDIDGIGGDNTSDCANYVAGACNVTNTQICMNYGVCNNATNVTGCRNYPSYPTDPTGCLIEV